MADLPKVAIVLVTYARTMYAVMTVESVRENLVYAGELGWYIGDDGSPPPHFEVIIAKVGKENIFDCHSEDFVPDRRWPGKSWNKAWETAHRWSPIVFWLEDDWSLPRKLDITAYVKMLMENERVGMVRLGHLAINLNMTSVGHGGIHYLQMWRNMQYAFSGNPSLRHRRFADAYGPYHEKATPGDTEIDYDSRFRIRGGPEIWWPVDLGGWGIFGHIGSEQSYE